MDQKSFDNKLKELTERRKQVLKALLSGQSDDSAAKELRIEAVTYRKHIQKIGEKFGFKNEPGERCEKRLHLIELFIQFKPEWVHAKSSRKLEEYGITKPLLEIEKLEKKNEVDSGTILSDKNTIDRKQDWGILHHQASFYGRKAELANLKQWIVNEKYKLVAIYGLVGIGKTSLIRYLAEQIKEDFEFIIWRSLEPAYCLENLIVELMKSILNEEFRGDSISYFTEYIKHHRCLIILDDIQGILSRKGLSGKYQKNYNDYEELIKQVAFLKHDSCIILSGHEQPRTISLLMEKGCPVQILQLTGLKKEDACQLLQAQGISDVEDKYLEKLIDFYNGNPSFLEIISTQIKKNFDNKVLDYFSLNTNLLGNISIWLDTQFSRLSSEEEKVMYWLAILQIPTSFSELLKQLIWQGSKDNILRALDSLIKRSLIEETNGKYKQHSVISKYVICRFTKEVIEEVTQLIELGQLQNSYFLHNYSLSTISEEEEIKKRQEYYILKPIKNCLLNEFCGNFELKNRLKIATLQLIEDPIKEHSYFQHNICKLISLL